MDPQQFEPMSIGRILDRTFTIYRNNFVRFITIVALIQVPIALLSLLSVSLISGGVYEETGESSEFVVSQETIGPEPQFETVDGPAASPVAIMCTAVLAGFLVFLGNMLAQAALTKSVSESYLNREITVGQAYRFVLPKALILIGASLLVGLVVGVGFLLLVVPGVIFSLWFYLTVPCIVVEDCGVTAGMSRSRALVSGNLGKVFLVGLLVGLISFAISMPFSMIAQFGAMFLWRDDPMTTMVVSQFINIIPQIIAMPISASAFILLYYDLRIRKEGFDLEMLAQSMSGQGNAGDVAPSY